VATITDLLTQGVPLEDVQYLAGHADPRTTRLYDRRQKQVNFPTAEAGGFPVNLSRSPAARFWLRR
jgi:hypothetical protein